MKGVAVRTAFAISTRLVMPLLVLLTGCAGSRFLNGNTVLHRELERKLAAQ